MAMNMHKFRCDDEVWAAAGKRAEREHTDRSVLIRQWLSDYVAGGEANASRAKVRLSAAERRTAAQALHGLDIVGIVVNTVNKER